VVDRCSKYVFCQAGTQYTLNRIRTFYPRKIVGVPLKKITKEEAREAAVRSGIRPEKIQPLAFVAEDGEKMVEVNPDAENGYPVMGKWSDPETQQPILDLAVDVRDKIQRAYDSDPRNGVSRWKKEMESAPETLKYVALKGKCKADPYSKKKVTERLMRFYNVFPRQVLLNIMRVTQVLDMTSAHVSKGNTRVHTAIGHTLVRGGAEELVDALERMVQDDGIGYVHVGDDSWVVAELDGVYYMFSVDCSSFDLTQRGDVLEAIHDELRDALELIHPPSAQLWHAYARSRCVTVVNSMVYEWSHGGPSGFPLQSKINDMMMDVYLRRVIAELSKDIRNGLTVLTRELVDGHMQSVATGMGLVARLEDFESVRADSLREALVLKPFLFIGFYFYGEREEQIMPGGFDEPRIYVVCDFARQFAQMPYPSSFWVDKESMGSMEAVRLGGIYMSSGRPPKEWQEMWATFRDGAAALLTKAARDTEVDLRWMPENAFVGISGDDVKSLMGLKNAVLRPVDVLWGHEGELETSTLLVGKSVPLERVMASGRNIRMYPPPTHPITERNVGRPPPTARWGPPKPPRVSRTLEKRVMGYERQAGLVAWDREVSSEDEYDAAGESTDFTESDHDEFDSRDGGSIDGDFRAEVRLRRRSDKFSSDDEDVYDMGQQWD
jgi:hypothetical protein